jgi:hypothetical protein
MSRYKFQLHPPGDAATGQTIRWFLARDDSGAFAKATEYVRTTAFPSRTRIVLLAVEPA